MKILTWNINGIRSVRKELSDLMKSSSYDVICVQETKVTRDQLDEPSAIVDGYNSYFSFSKGRSGYSGVATFVKDSCTPIKAEESISGVLVPDEQDAIGCYGDHSGFSDEEIYSLDNEGRTIITQHKMMDSDGAERLLNIVNVYCPRADPENEQRKVFKIRFYQLLQIRVDAMLKNSCHVVLLGDVNTPHKKLDHCDPPDDQEFYTHPGRRWLTQFLWDPERDGDLNEVKVKYKSDPEHSLTNDAGGLFVDMFRLFHPSEENAFTCWSTVTGSRATNYGVRIDYIFGDIELVADAGTGCDIMPGVMGSDHCPVQAQLDWEIIPSKKCPEMCTRFMPEFSGRQQKLLSFFTKKDQVVKVSDTSVSELSKVKTHDFSQEGNDSRVCSVKSKPGKLNVGNSHTLSDRPDNLGKKRSATEPSMKSDKRLKKDDKQLSLGKQGSLLNFFGKKCSKETFAKSETKSVHGIHNATKLESDASPETYVESTKLASSNTPSLQKSASASWKNLLKGPPPPPLCKGHQEPCLLRTVKKDSLNKGRQFWVCPKPEGHKSNPDARCDYFVWIDKKKKL